MTSSIRSEATQAVVKVSGVDQLFIKDTGALEVRTAGAADKEVCVMGQSKLSSAVAQASTSGTSIDFTGIPAWAKRVTVLFNGVSTNGTGGVLVQLGTSAGVVTTGYVGAAGGGTPTATTAGHLIYGGAVAAITHQGAVTFFLLTGTSWIGSGSIALDNASVTSASGSRVNLPGVLDRIRVIAGSSDVFDAGSVNIMWE